MSSSSKLIIATALLAVGYGVASFLGSPRAPYLSPATRAALENHLQNRSDRSAPVGGDTSLSLTNARLVPEIASSSSLGTAGALPPPVAVEARSFGASVTRAETDGATNEPSSPVLLPATIEAEPILSAASLPASPPDSDWLTPLVRPSVISATIPNETRGAAARPTTDAPRFGAQLIDAHWSSPERNAQNLAPSATTIGSTPVLAPNDIAAASFYGGGVAPSETAHTAPPTPIEHAIATSTTTLSPTNTADLRRHIVVDGDSLERLASRYLNDSVRATEIFELNRELLQNPDLLPIGAELKIPPRRERAPDQVAVAPLAPAASFDQAGVTGSVPIRPVPNESAIAPRAQLLGPLPVGWRQETAE